jgi:hypothetical protein
MEQSQNDTVLDLGCGQVGWWFAIADGLVSVAAGWSGIVAACEFCPDGAAQVLYDVRALGQESAQVVARDGRNGLSFEFAERHQDV